MLARALLAFVLLPGMVAFAAPFLIAGFGGTTRIAHPTGLVLVAAGSVMLLWCVHDFSVRGKGTLAPWAPPRLLVKTGLYRYSRNPMYVAVLVVLSGWAVAFESRTLWLYLSLVALAFHLRVVLGEEPWLARRYGDQWRTYRSRVRRWF